MQSVLHEVSLLRGGRHLTIDYRNSNRYCLIIREEDGTRTAYYFSTPIYNQKTRKMVDLAFHQQGGSVYAVGSNTNITVSKDIRLENAEGFCLIKLHAHPTTLAATQIGYGKDRLYPTTNGVALKAHIQDTGRMSFTFEVSQPYMDIRANGKSVALMRERFRPFVVFSSVGTLDAAGRLIAPAKMDCQRLDNRRYQITVTSASPLGVYTLLEGNLYEHKILLDTTVESGNPKVNNAFGGTAFIGNTALFGEQWLYAKLDYSKLSGLMDKRVNKIMLHMPQYSAGYIPVSAFKVKARFCSFGSNWNNRIAGDNHVSDSVCVNGYQSIDLTPLLVDTKRKVLTHSEGIILRSKVKERGFSAVATGDSYYSPPVIEANYR